MRLRRFARSISIVAVLLLLVVGNGLAQSGGGYDLTWNTADNGAYGLTGGSYTLESTVGQPEAGALAAGAYTLSSGFLFGGNYQVYLPLVLRGL